MTTNYYAGTFLLSTSDPTGIQSTYSDDWLGRVSREVVNSAGGTAGTMQTITTLSYDGFGLRDHGDGLQRDAESRLDALDDTVLHHAILLPRDDGQRSAIDSNDLLSRVQYPDGTTEQCGYDALGELIVQTNRDRSAHKYQRDVLGRQILDTVVTFATGVDQTIRALGTTYDTLGDVTLATSYGGNWGIVNQVENVYDGLGNW